MKLSLKLQGHDENHHRSIHHMTAKLPITIFNHPFLSTITASTSSTTASGGSDFCFSLSTNFPSGPCLKLSYSPTATASLPFSLSLKSGLGLKGCPRHSPLVFSASFILSPSYAPLPSFFLHLKPQFGHFSLSKTVFSDPIPPAEPPKPYSATASPDRNSASSGWQEMKLEPFGGRDNNSNINNNSNDTPGTVFVPESSLLEKNNNRNGVSAGVAVMARTVVPVTKGVLLNLRWGVNFPEDSGLKMPYLTVNKIGLERVVEEAKQENDDNKKGRELEMLKGMCLWMKKDLEDAEKENREMKQLLDEIRIGVSGNGGRKVSHSQHSGAGSSEFERWRSKKSVREENEKKEPPPPPPPKPRKQQQQNVASDVESELQKAIQAASAAAAASS